jgi:hypothetical protein
MWRPFLFPWRGQIYFPNGSNDPVSTAIVSQLPLRMCDLIAI